MFHQPRTFEQALELKARYGQALTPIAGGTDLVVALNAGQWQPTALLDLTRIAGNRSIERHNGYYAIAAGATYADISRLPITALREAASSIGGAQIRNRGTLAGNLVTASPAGDGVVALLALDATIEIAHATRAARLVPVREFFVDYRRTVLAPDELIARIRVPADWTSAWYKIGKRSSVNISLVCCAVGRSPQGRFCIGLGCAGPCPTYPPKTEALLNEHPLTPRLIEQAAELVTTEVRPIDDHRGSAAYRRAMCGTLLRRLLTEAFLPSGDRCR